MPPRKQVITFFLITLFFSAWHLDQGQNANTVSRAAMVAAIVEQGTLRIDAFATLTDDRALVEGHYYSEKAALPALLVVPFHWAAHTLGLIDASSSDHINVDLLRLGGLLAGSIPFALIITLCWGRLYRSRAAVPLCWLLFFGSFLFVYSGAFFGHLMGAMFALAALMELEEGSASHAGFLIACAVWCDHPIAIIAMCWTAFLAIRAFKATEGRGALRGFLTGAAPVALAFCTYQFIVFGGPLAFGYDHVDQYRPAGGSIIEGLHPEALIGLTLSPYRGLLPHMPLLALGAVLWWWCARPKWPRPGLLVGVPAILTLLFVCSVGMWWGGWAFGPRHLTTVAVLLAYRSAQLILATAWARVPALVLGSLGVTYAFLAKSTVWYSLPSDKRQPLGEVIIPALDQWGLTRYQWPVVLGATPTLATALFVITFAIALFVLSRTHRPHASVPLP
ncbi:MAG TPA: hypothetical protein PLL57_07295 [Flavobacteriales bacterium]|nr:hypothetical protein [Flavobacteriales bacterium]